MNSAVNIRPWQDLPSQSLAFRVHQNTLVPEDSFTEIGKRDEWSVRHLVNLPLVGDSKTLEVVMAVFAAGVKEGGDRARYEMRKAIGAL